MQFKFHSTEYLIEPYISKAITHKNEEFVITDLIDPKTLHAYLSSDPDKLTVKLMTYEIKTLLANKVTTSQKPTQELINNFRQKFVNESELQFNELYDIKHDDYKEDISYYTTSGEYELIVNYSTDSTIQDLGNIDVVNFNLPNKNINIKISSAHYIINNKVDYISFALCCRKLYNKYPNLKTIIVIPEKLNMQIINKIIQKEFNNNLVKIITYEATNTN
jgi:hypothetical protein